MHANRKGIRTMSGAPNLQTRAIYLTADLALIGNINIYSIIGIPAHTRQEELPAIEPANEPARWQAWAILRDPQQRLAWHLLCGKLEKLTCVQLVHALFSSEHRLNRARELLRDAAAGRATNVSQLDTLWALTEKEWLWVRRSPQVRHHLHQQAEILGIADAAAATDSVLRAVEEELLPLLHLKEYLKARRSSPKEAGIHGRYLGRWQLRPDADDALLNRYGAFLEELKGDPTIPIDRIGPTLEAIGRARGGHDPRVLALFRRYAELMRARYQQPLSKLPSTVWLANQLSFTENIESLAPPMHTLVELRALGHLALGVRRINKHIDAPAGVLNLARAQLLAPYNGEVQARIENARELLAFLESQPDSAPVNSAATSLISWLVFIGAQVVCCLPLALFDEAVGVIAAILVGLAAIYLRIGFRRLRVSELRPALSAALYALAGFAQTAEGQALKRRSDESLLRELALRLGLPASDPEVTTAVRKLVTLLDTAPAAAQYAAGALKAPYLRSKVLEQAPELSCLPWQLIEPALAQVSGQPAVWLVLHLPLPTGPHELSIGRVPGSVRQDSAASQ